MFAALFPFFKGVVGKGLLSTVASTAISSIAQRSAAKAQRNQALGDQAEQFVRLRDAAEKAGFNPLTALRANPTGGMVNPTPALASGSFVTDALGAGIETYFNRDKIIKDEERDMLERQLMRQELANMQMQGKAFQKSMNFGFGVGNPTWNNYTGVAPPADPVLSFNNTQWTTHSGTSDTQRVEDRYGDVASEFYGLGVMARDFATWLRKRNWRNQDVQMTDARQREIDQGFFTYATPDSASRVPAYRDPILGRQRNFNE
jgi:hypothetical protein